MLVLLINEDSTKPAFFAEDGRWLPELLSAGLILLAAQARALSVLFPRRSAFPHVPLFSPCSPSMKPPSNPVRMLSHEADTPHGAEGETAKSSNKEHSDFVPVGAGLVVCFAFCHR